MLALASECINMSRFLLRMPLDGRTCPGRKGYHPRLQVVVQGGLSCKRRGGGVGVRVGRAIAEINVEFRVAWKTLDLDLNTPKERDSKCPDGKLG